MKEAKGGRTAYKDWRLRGLIFAKEQRVY